MTYKVEYSKKADRKLSKIDPAAKRKIYNWITNNLVGCDNPRLYGKALRGELKDYWRYRVGAYRIIVLIHDNILTVLVVDIDHRSSIYRHQ